MIFLRTWFLLILLLVLSLPNALAAKAAHITLDAAVASVKKDEKIKILDAETIELKGKMVHQIKLLTKDGHVKKILINTTSD
tara:strand:- start:166733 stop:166978 length:246 start_codon:yes stop_codon:yes gene_type:complete